MKKTTVSTVRLKKLEFYSSWFLEIDFNLKDINLNIQKHKRLSNHAIIVKCSLAHVMLSVVNKQSDTLTEL